MISVLLADDQSMLRMGFRLILEAEDDLRVIGEAADGQTAVRMAGVLRPHIVLMDVRMPLMDGVAATAAICSGNLTSKVIILTTFDLDDYIYASLQAGASGFLLKDAPASDLVAAIATVAGGDAVLAPSVTKRLIGRFASLQPDPHSQPAQHHMLAELTDREQEVLHLLAAGKSNREIAGQLYLSEGTVKIHVGRILAKLDLRDRDQAVVFAYETGLVRPHW